MIRNVDWSTVRRLLLMQKEKHGPVDLFDGSDARINNRIYQTGIGRPVQFLSSEASIVYCFACPLIAGEQYKIQYTVTDPISTGARAWCISDADGVMVYYDGMTARMNAGNNEVTLTAHDDGFLWMTMDKNASDIHIYKE